MKTKRKPSLPGGAQQFVAAIAGLLLALTAGSASAAKGGPTNDAPIPLRQQALVEDLPVCYAYGTDLLGRAVNAVLSSFPEDPVNIGDPEFDEALALYRRCFSKDFSFTLEFDGVPVLTVPDTTDGLDDTDPALQWANFVNDAFRGPGFRNTQHHMGSISSEVGGGKGHIVSYLIATHAYGPTSNTTGVRVVGGTYTDKVVRERGRWVILQRTLNITSVVEVPQ